MEDVGARRDDGDLYRRKHERRSVNGEQGRTGCRVARGTIVRRTEGRYEMERTICLHHPSTSLSLTLLFLAAFHIPSLIAPSAR